MYRKFIIVLLITALLITDSTIPAKASVQSLTTSQSSTENTSEASSVQPMVAAGFWYSVILKEDGTVWSCGQNQNGQLGIGKTSYSSKPIQVKGLTDVIEVDATQTYALALKRDGTVWGWGDAFLLGNTKPEFCLYPSKISGLKDVKAIAAGTGMSLFLKKDGTVWYIYEKEDDISSPLTQMKGLSDIVSIKTKNLWNIALKKDGTVYIWELDCESNNIPTPAKQKITNVKAIAAGGNHFLALKKDKTVWAFGVNNDGQLGDGTYTSNEKNFVQVKGLKNISLIGTGYYGSYAVDVNGDYYAWGDNTSGQYGNNSKKTSNKPVKVTGLSDIVSIDGERCHTVALKSNGEVVEMGDILLGGNDDKTYVKPYEIMDLNEVTAQTSKEIIPDGTLTDWYGIDPLAYGKVNVKGATQKGIQALYACKDSKYLYIAADITSKIPPVAVFGLEFNMTGDPDYSIHFAVEKNAMIFRFNSKGRTTDGYGVYGDVIELKIPLADLGNPKNIYINCTYNDDEDKYGSNSEVYGFHKVPVLSKETDGTPYIKKASLMTGKIILDGLSDDWDAFEHTTINDPAGDNGKNHADITDIYAAMDQDYLYVAVKIDAVRPCIGVKLDCDGDGVGDYEADYSVEYNNKYKYIVYDEVYEFAIPLSKIGNPEKISIDLWGFDDNDKDYKSDNPGASFDVAVITS